MKQNIFTWKNDGEKKTTRFMLALSNHFGVKQVGNAGGDIIVTLPYKRNPEIEYTPGEWFTLCDNGGEINVEPINHEERMRSIPYTSNEIQLTCESMAWRVWCAMTGQEIDWTWNDAPAAAPELETMKL